LRQIRQRKAGCLEGLLLKVDNCANYFDSHDESNSLVRFKILIKQEAGE
jgi:hypothetical protein